MPTPSVSVKPPVSPAPRKVACNYRSQADMVRASLVFGPKRPSEGNRKR
jgi:hypothetical protein